MNRECTCWVNYPNESHRFKNGRCKCTDYYENVYTGLKSNYRATTKCVMKDGYAKYGKEVKNMKCSTCGKEFTCGNRPDGLPNGVGFELEDGSIEYVCTDCVCKAEVEDEQIDYQTN